MRWLCLVNFLLSFHLLPFFVFCSALDSQPKIEKWKYKTGSSAHGVAYDQKREGGD